MKRHESAREEFTWLCFSQRDGGGRKLLVRASIQTCVVTALICPP